MVKKREIVVPISKYKKETKQYMTKGDSFTGSFVNNSTNTENYKAAISGILEPNESDKKLETKDITVNDLFALMISEEQANKILENKLHISKHEKTYIDESTKKLNTEGICYFNNLLHESIDFYERVFHEKLYDTYIKKRSKDKLGRPICKNHEEVIKFLIYNSKNKSDDINRSHHCFLLKIMRALNDFNMHQKKFDEAQKNFDEIKRKQILPNFKTPQGKEADKIENIDHLTLRTSSGISNKDIVFFSMDSRIKEKERIIVKMLSNSKYNTSRTIQDIYGIRNTVRRTIKVDKKSSNHATTKEENEEYKKKAILLLEYYRKMFPAEIDYKDLFGENQDDIKELIIDIETKYQLDETFKEMLLNSIKPKKERTGRSERKSGQNYKEVKLKPIIKDINGKYHPIEIQIVIEGNRNESGTSHHGIYEVKAVIEAEVRGRGFTTEDKIKLYINDSIERNIKECLENNENPDILYLGGLDWNQKYNEIKQNEKEYFKSRTATYIFDHIKNDFLRGQELNYPEKSKESIYTTKTQRDKFHNKKNEDMYPADISRRE